MTSTRISLQQFLVQARSSFIRGLEKPEWQRDLNIVIGNESADLDTIASTLLISYLSSCTPPPAPTPTYHSDPTPPTIPNRLYTPLANLHCADLRLRPELLALLPHVDVDVSTLVTLDDLPPLEEREQKLAPGNTRWVLVDHNCLQGELGKAYAERVVGVIDHHEDEKKVPQDTGNEPRVITKAGSCASLVTNYFADGWDRLSAHRVATPMPVDPEHRSYMAPGMELGLHTDSGALFDAQLAKLALGAILIDTANLTSKDNTTEHDTKAVTYLEAKIAASGEGGEEGAGDGKGKWDRTKFYQEIKAAKEDLQDLTVEECLRKDYKEWNQGSLKLGISCVVKPLSWLVEKAGKEQDKRGKGEEIFYGILSEYAEKRGLDLVGVMTAFTGKEGFQRELLVWGVNGGGVKAAKRFAEKGEGELGLEGPSVEGLKACDVNGTDGWRKVWQQRELGKSRKQVAPLLGKAMAG